MYTQEMVESNVLLLFWRFLSPLSTDPPCQLDILWHNGHTLGVDCAQVGVLEKANQVSFTGLLQKNMRKYFSTLVHY